MLANALYLIATRYGPLSLVATLASLYPASTVLLARVTLGERLSGSQALGVVVRARRCRADREHPDPSSARLATSSTP